MLDVRKRALSMNPSLLGGAPLLLSAQWQWGQRLVQTRGREVLAQTCLFFSLVEQGCLNMREPQNA